MSWTMRIDDDSRGFTVPRAPGGVVSFRQSRSENGRLWYRVTERRGGREIELESEVVQGTPLACVFDALETVSGS